MKAAHSLRIARPTPEEPHKLPLRLRRFFSRLGPGLITGAADDDPSGISTYSVTGAAYRYAPCGPRYFLPADDLRTDDVCLWRFQPSLIGAPYPFHLDSAPWNGRGLAPPRMGTPSIPVPIELGLNS